MEGQRLRTAETLSTAQDNTPQRNPLLSPPSLSSLFSLLSSLFSLLSSLSYPSILFHAQNYQNYFGKSTAWKSLWSLFPNSGSLYRIPVMSCPPWCECTRGQRNSCEHLEPHACACQGLKKVLKNVRDTDKTEKMCVRRVFCLLTRRFCGGFDDSLRFVTILDWTRRWHQQEREKNIN